MATAELETLLHNVDVSILKDLADRIRDKKVWLCSCLSISIAKIALAGQRSVAVEALKNISRLYDLAYPEMSVLHFCPVAVFIHQGYSEAQESAVIEHFGWIPEYILDYYPRSDRFMQ